MRASRKLCFIVCLCLILLSACSRQRPRAQLSPDVPLPEPSAEADDMFLGEQRAAQRHDVMLYYVAGDGVELVPVLRTIYAADRLALIRAAVQTLLTTPGGGQLPIAPGDTQLLSVECTGGACTVNLSVDARNVQTDQELYQMYAAISATLLGLEGISGVNVLIGGQSEAVNRMPVGVFCGASDTIVSAMAQLQAESDRFLAGDTAARGTVTRRALLYYPSISGELLLPELREVSFEDANYAAGLLNALKELPQGSDSSAAPLPPGLDTLAAPPNSYISEAGQRLLDLEFTALADVYLESAGLTRDQFCASLTLTMCSFVPELDGVRVFIDGELVEEIHLPGAEIALEDGVQTRLLYADCVGSAVKLYFAGEQGGLATVSRIVPQACAVSPFQALEQLFFGPIAGEELTSALPAGITALDVLGVTVEDGVARVNLSGNFYRCCQALGEAEERNAAYAIVNTLCQLDGVNGVRLYIEGSAADLLTDSIYLKSMLLYNPGIVEGSPGEYSLDPEG